MRYGFIIDQTTCIGCHACTVACKTEHDVPLGVNRTWVKYVESGTWPDTTRSFSVMRCNHCTNAPCVAICPTSALFRRDDGIVDFNTDSCIGCKSCMQACPYDALYIDPNENTAQKCNYCVHRVEAGIEPACVIVCPEQAIIAGDLDDPETKIAQWVATLELTQRAPEQGTEPNLWYRGAAEINIEPLAAERNSDGGIWKDPAGMGDSWLSVDLTAGVQAPGPQVIDDDDGAPRVVYSNDSPMPWGWRVSSYFLTKGIAAGIAIVAALALSFGASSDTAWMLWIAPLVAGMLLALTGVFLVWDLKRPDRFFYLLTKGNPSSWLVRGAWILGAYAAVLGAWFLAGVAGADGFVSILIVVAAVVAVAVAGYTAFLFAQAEARDLWQSKTLLLHMVASAIAVGGGVSLVAGWFDSAAIPTDTSAFLMTVGAGVLGLVTIVELFKAHPTDNATEAAHHLTKGTYARQHWIGFVLGCLVPVATGYAHLAGAPIAAAAVGGLAGLVGVWLLDDAFVRAGQSVPLT